MASRDPRVDAYIAAAAPFAQPILERLRTLVHQACPQVQETMKWSMPFFTDAGGILCNMAAFKQHASFGFWKHAEVMGKAGPRDGMGSLGRLRAVADVPAKQEFIALVHKAMQLNGVPVENRMPRRPVRSRPELAVPEDLQAALARNRRAADHFAGFSSSQRRDYIEWLTEAKREETRQRRLAQAIEWLAEGRTRHWKYERD